MNLNKITKDFKIFIDTCVLMHPHAELFFKSLKKSLLLNQEKLYHHLSVKAQLHGLAKGDAQKNNIEKYGQYKAEKIANQKAVDAKRGEKIIEEFKEEGCGQGFKTGKDIGATDNNYVALFTQYRHKYNLCLLTNDIGLSKEIQNLNKSESSEFDKSGNKIIKKIIVIRVDKKGHPYLFTIPQKFNNSNKLEVLNKVKILNPVIPGLRDKVKDEDGNIYELKSDISKGGGLEGIVYSTNFDYVCKIFKERRLTDLKLQKLKLMITKKPYVKGVCWPLSILYNYNNDAVGYLMLLAGKFFDEAIDLWHIIGKKNISKFYPDYKTLDLVEVSLDILDKIDQLHQYNIILGDIKPANILITSKNSFIYFVDTDNYQIENLPCTGGEPEFTPPERQGLKYDTYLRTIEEESFAVATLLFMIFMLRIAPFRKKFGGTVTENIKGNDFPYRLNGMESGKELVVGLKRWKRLPDYLQKAFYNFFTNKESIGVPDWIEILNRYSSEWNKKLKGVKQ